MVRLNIESCWWIDPRREKLASLLNDNLKATAVAIHAWRLAQRFWLNGQLIPGHIFVQVYGFAELILSDLAILYPADITGDIQQLSSMTPANDQLAGKPHQHDGEFHQHVVSLVKKHSIYMRGCKNYMGWCFAMHQKNVAAGKARARSADRDKSGRFEPTKGSPAGIQQVSSGIQPSSSSSSSSSSSKSFKRINEKNTRTNQSSLTTPLWKIYETCILERYGVKPNRGAKVNSQLNTILKAVGQHDAESVVKFYVNHNRQFYTNNKHPVGALVSDLHKLTIEMKSGIVAPEYQEKSHTGKWLTSEEKRRQNTLTAVEEAIADDIAKTDGAGRQA